MLVRSVAVVALAALIFWLRQPAEEKARAEALVEEDDDYDDENGGVRTYAKFEGWGNKAAGAWDKKGGAREDSATSSESDATRRLTQWLERGKKKDLRNGAALSGASVVEASRDGTRRRGLVAARDLEMDSTVVAIPRRCIVTVDMGEATEVGVAVSHVAELAPHLASGVLYLTLFVAADRGNDRSFFAPYYATLPESFDELPIFWSEATIAALEGSWFQREVRERQRSLRWIYDAIRTTAYPPYEPDFHTFKCAWAVASTRGFPIPKDDDDDDASAAAEGDQQPTRWAPALVPLVDVIDHGLRGRVRHVAVDRPNDFYYVLKAVAPVGRGSPLETWYSDPKDRVFLHTHGPFQEALNQRDDPEFDVQVDLLNPQRDDVSSLDDRKVALIDTIVLDRATSSTRHAPSNKKTITLTANVASDAFLALKRVCEIAVAADADAADAAALDETNNAPSSPAAAEIRRFLRRARNGYSDHPPDPQAHGDAVSFINAEKAALDRLIALVA